MSDLIQISNPSIKFRKIMGRTYLNEDRLKDAVEIYLGILKDDPEDVDTLLELGNLYLASGNGRTAAQLFRKVLELAPERSIIQKQLQLASDEEQNEVQEEPVPTSSEAITRLLQRLTGKTEPISDQDISLAYNMLQEIMLSGNPAAEVAAHLDEITNLLPALIELNIRQARADGNAAVADALQNLQINIALQKNTEDGATDAGSDRPKRGHRGPGRRHFKGHAFLLLPDKNHPGARMTFVADTLNEHGCRVTVGGDITRLRFDKPDVVIASNPYLSPVLSQHLAACSAARVPVVVDHDTDFENLPVFHPDYSTRGPGRLANSKAYTASLVLADVISASSQVMAESFQAAGYCAEWLPDGWRQQEGEAALLPTARRDLALGWVGESRLLEDLAMIRRVIIRVLHEFEAARVVVIGNPQAYQLLENIPMERKEFVPYPDNGDLLSWMRRLDILMVPLSGHPYNQTQPDTLLMEAGRAGVPWVASSVPAFEEWQAGGLIIPARDEWHTYLRQLVMDRSLRESLGSEGRKAAELRESKYTGTQWISLIEKILKKKTVSAPREVCAGGEPSLNTMRKNYGEA